MMEYFGTHLKVINGRQLDQRCLKAWKYMKLTLAWALKILKYQPIESLLIMSFLVSKIQDIIVFNLWPFRSIHIMHHLDITWQTFSQFLPDQVHLMMSNTWLIKLIVLVFSLSWTWSTLTHLWTLMTVSVSLMEQTINIVIQVLKEGINNGIQCSLTTLNMRSWDSYFQILLSF